MPWLWLWSIMMMSFHDLSQYVRQSCCCARWRHAARSRAAWVSLPARACVQASASRGSARLQLQFGRRQRRSAGSAAAAARCSDRCV